MMVKETASIAPKKAAPLSPSLNNQDEPSSVDPNAVIMKATPSDAPEALPSKYGSARGFLNSPCASAPDKPSSAPASQAPRVRGKRISQIICKPLGSWRVAGVISKPELPMAQPKPTKITDNTQSAVVTVLLRLLGCESKEFKE